MIRYLQHGEINKNKWDECVANSLNTLIYAYSWYLDIASPDWDALVIDDYKAVFPLPNKSKLGIKYIYPSYFIQQLGLFFTEEKFNNSKTIEDCIKNIPNKFKFIELYLNEYNKINLNNEYKIIERKNYLLHLKKSYEEIFNNYSHGLKENIKKALSNDLTIRDSDDVNSFVRLFQENTGKDLSKFNQEHYKILTELIKAAISQNSAEISLSYYKEELVAGAVLLKDKNRIIYLISSSTEKGKRFKAMPLLLDHNIKKHSSSNFIFDFEGSMVPGIAKFFKSFGSAESVYLQIKINRLPKIISWLKE